PDRAGHAARIARRGPGPDLPLPGRRCAGYLDDGGGPSDGNLVAAARAARGSGSPAAHRCGGNGIGPGAAGRGSRVASAAGPVATGTEAPRRAGTRTG